MAAPFHPVVAQSVSGPEDKARLLYFSFESFVKRKIAPCCSKVIMSGVNGNVIMSGWTDDNPDDERREAARVDTKSTAFTAIMSKF